MKRNYAVIAVVALAVAMMLYIGLKRDIGSRASAKTGSAPQFSLKDLQGKDVKLADLRGKAVLVNFWATWCPPCKTEIPYFVEVQKQFGDQGLAVVGITMDEDLQPAEIQAFAEKLGINYTLLMGNDGVADQFGVISYPTSFYLGRDGRIMEKVVGLRPHKEVVELVEKALATQAVAEAR